MTNGSLYYSGRLIQVFSPVVLQIFFILALPSVFLVAGYMYEETLQWNHLTFVLSIIFSLLSGFLIMLSDKSLTSVFYTIFHSFIVAPMFAVATYASSISISYTHLIVIFCFLLFFFVTDRAASAFVVNVRASVSNSKYDNLYTLIYTAIFSIIVFRFGFNDINILKTYIHQYEIRSGLEHSFPYSYMLNFWLGIFAAAPAIFIARKSYWFFVFSIYVAMYIYTIYPLVAVIFQSVLILFIFISVSISQRYFQYLNFQLLFSIIIITCFYIIYFIDEPSLYMIFNRAFYVIGWNTYYYLDFFTEENLYLFRGGLMDLGSSYSEPIGFIIDRVYYSGEGSNQSSGGIASLYANGGILGVILGAIVFGFLVNLATWVSSNLYISFILVLTLAVSFVNFPLQQLIMSNGFFILFLMFFVRMLFKVRKGHLVNSD